jgi:hypothetical protein
MLPMSFRNRQPNRIGELRIRLKVRIVLNKKINHPRKSQSNNLSPWSTSCPKWSSGGLAIRVAISLCEHNLVSPALTQNLLNNSKYVEIWKKLQ